MWPTWLWKCFGGNFRNRFKMDLTVLSTCPVCYEIIREPVMFPCKHEICLTCFKKSLETANHWCPICRKRISSWARRNVNNPVSSERKRKIEEVLAKCDINTLMKSTESTNDERCWKLSEPGEVRKDYLCELDKMQEERSMEESVGEEEARRLDIENQVFAAERAEEEKIGEAVARSVEQEEAKKRLDSDNQDEYDMQMAEVLSQEFILKQIDARKLQVEQDLKLAQKLSDHSNSSPCADQLPTKKKRPNTQTLKPITHWFHSLSN
ncbi:E3 ubiquitin-protein ligase rnf168-like [Halichondria panicea]|uniref:E3 ubiquitin-protein ligase rnf168-like n=1 Tax=Halichondria panicea TaxID=6063 RepID=UPI00312BC40D